MKVHDLKTDPQPFDDVWNLKKTFEIRQDDRGFNVGDELLLRETRYTGSEMKNGEPLIYTRRRCQVRVSHILRGPIYGLAEGWVIMSLEPNYCLREFNEAAPLTEASNQ